MDARRSQSMRVVGILLAAGRGSRFGGDKLVAPLRAAAHGVPAGTPLGVAAARNLVAALPESVAVIRPGDAALAHLLMATGMRVVECTNADAGMGASLACAVRATADADAWIVALADMPWIDPATIVTVADALRAGADVAAPALRGQRGHPVGFSRRYQAELAALTGDVGARGIIQRNAAELTAVDVDDPGILGDVDRPADLAGMPNKRDASAV
ncbi:MAG TPA: nucleotidyltransferase family protein [Casimicrobiaceae bacterium]|nr:nucleotidyltransferase family protein [Casimicrobiaceae bacterium]